MEKNENKENSQIFKTVQNPNTYKEVYGPEKTKNSSSFGRSFLLPFFSGVLGCSVVIGTCFGVPSIKEKLIGLNIV